MNDKVTAERQGDVVRITLDPAKARRKALKTKKSLTVEEKLDLVLIELAEIRRAMGLDD